MQGRVGSSEESNSRAGKRRKQRYIALHGHFSWPKNQIFGMVGFLNHFVNKSSDERVSAEASFDEESKRRIGCT
jgi:hypothetical protein